MSCLAEAWSSSALIDRANVRTAAISGWLGDLAHKKAKSSNRQ
jgi:hypothetical protein